jgi:ADP-ribosylglycohydrolase
MRVSPVAWFFDSLAEVEQYAKVTAAVTHNHPEGIKGAQATAAAIYMARTGASKQDIRYYIEETYGYDLNRTVDSIRPGYSFDVTCQGSVPEAIIAFLDRTSFEDAIINAISLGGDADTQAAIAASIAEAFYGVPQALKEQVLALLDDVIRGILQLWNTQVLRA